jgi:hypothetical protein
MLGGRNVRIREFSTPGKFSQATQVFNYSIALNANKRGRFENGPYFATFAFFAVA